MGEEHKKAEEPKLPQVEEKTEEAPKTEQVEKPTEENKQEKKAEVDNSAKEPPKETATPPPPPPPPPPPQEIVLKIYMHCEGCARKVRRCLKGFDGVEEVQTDCKTQKVVIKGDKADPMKVLERVQKKSNRKVELLSPIPKPPPPPEEPKKTAEEKEVPKNEGNIEEAQKITVVVCVHMHCEACAQAIRKRILRMKGVESVEADLKSSLVKVEGTIEAQALVEFIYKKTAKQAKIVKVEPHKKEEEKAKEEDKGSEENKGKGDKKDEVQAKGGPEEGEKEKKEGGGDNDDGGVQPPKGDALPPQPQPQAIAMPQEESSLMELRRNEAFYYPTQNYYQPPQSYYYYQQPHQQDYYYQPPNYPQRYGQEMYGHPPQIFSDENPNACSLM
ncbi:hypothetical protein LIER_27879 [Lithospermum erythrorhizon]|uniref:HMA domain-containing protein n=1 Tax=Lithospermum erythrorhizon TaxID=34254 RepID=A0AAV3RHJ0_LITER